MLVAIGSFLKLDSGIVKYKVGRIEQLETSDQAKARGANTIIPRKLVQVLTPSTASEGNLGPDPVHLLAIKEVCYLS
ncbi:BnaA09g55690D [Brassica napus]|uniref:(rape) hypothetical protein n=1 Tax=Brassica napus TaxID=3708 RepID=A0A078J2L2_BRANA|nr:unnamed protein product [Brassica napus]CDY56451.1 BnaA09g55690D [Brassica napus]